MKYYELSELQRKKLKSLIAKSPYSQEKLCKMIGISNASLSRILNGIQRCKWDDDKWKMLAGKLGYSQEGLLEMLGLKTKENGKVELVDSFAYEAVPVPMVTYDYIFKEARWHQITADKTLTIPRLLVPKADANYVIYWAQDRGLEPFIMRDDSIIIEVGERKIVDGAIYLLAIDSVIPRRATTPCNGNVKFYSDNPTYYPDIIISLTNPDAIIGRVVATFRKL